MAAAMRAALGRLGFSAQASTYIANDQGLDTLDEWKVLTDSEVENLCKVVRKPGGTVDDDGVVPNPGHQVPLRAENNLKLACYFLRFMDRVSRPVHPVAVTMHNVTTFRDLRKWEDEYEDVDKPEIDAKDWPKTIEAIENWLAGCLGITKIPLAYVIREEINPPAANTDPQHNYQSLRDEMINRAPIMNATGQGFNSTYLADRANVWEKLSSLTRNHECWTYVRPGQKHRDGRLAFQGLKGHYLGANSVDNMSSKAEKLLQTTTYSGDRRRWNFERFVRIHVDQHQILRNLTDHGYAGIDERSKVRHLLNGIKTKDLDPVKTRIMSDAGLRQDFDACVNLFQDFLVQSKTDLNVREANISAASTQRSGVNDEADFSVEDRYYKKSEYDKLTNAQKLGLKLKRSKRGGSGSKSKPSSGQVNLSKATIKALASAFKPPSDLVDMSNDSSEGSDDPPAKKSRMSSNRDNPALKKK